MPPYSILVQETGRPQSTQIYFEKKKSLKAFPIPVAFLQASKQLGCNLQVMKICSRVTQCTTSHPGCGLPCSWHLQSQEGKMRARLINVPFDQQMFKDALSHEY